MVSLSLSLTLFDHHKKVYPWAHEYLVHVNVFLGHVFGSRKDFYCLLAQSS